MGATIFQLGGFFASQAQHLGAVSGAAWLPLKWLCVVRLARRFEWRWTARLAAALAMSVLAGFPAVTIVVFATCGLLAALLVLLRQARFGLLAAVAAAGAWAALLSAAQLLPAVELVRLSTAPLRSQWADAQGGGVPLVGLVSLLVPGHHEIFDLKRYALSWNPTFLYRYCGWPGLALGAAAVARWRDRRVQVFAPLTLLAGLWMLGRSTPVGAALFTLLPSGAKAALYPEFAMVSFVLGVAVLAGLGAEPLFAREGSRLPAAVVLLAAVDLIAAGAGRPMNTAAVREDPGVTNEGFEGSRQTLAGIHARVNREAPPARVDTFNDSHHWAMSAGLLEVPTANGNDPLALARYLAVRRIFAPGPEWVRHLPVKFPKVETLPGHHVHENLGALPRFFLAGEVRRAANLEQTLSLLRSPQFDPRRVAVVEGLAGEAQFHGAGTVRVLRYSAQEIELETEATAPVFLVSSEVYYPGWRAWVDDQPQPLALTNGAFRGLAVPAGLHRIRMRFAPGILWQGLALSALAVAALGVCLGRGSGPATCV